MNDDGKYCVFNLTISGLHESFSIVQEKHVQEQIENIKI